MLTETGVSLIWFKTSLMLHDAESGMMGKLHMQRDVSLYRKTHFMQTGHEVNPDLLLLRIQEDIDEVEFRFKASFWPEER